LKTVVEATTRPSEKIFAFAGQPQAYFDRDLVVAYESTLGNLVQDTFWAPLSHTPRFSVRFRFLPVTTRQVRVVNNTDSPGYWTIAEMRVLSQGVPVVRQPDWRVSGWPNEWEAQLAFDNNYATRWSTWEPMGPHARLGIEFPAEQRIDEIVLECDPAREAKLQVEILLPSGRWVALTDTQEYIATPPPPGIRRAAALEVKSLGFRYLLINQDDSVYADFRKYPAFWGITHLAESNGTHFYRID
jgi:hypothetical protein